MNDISNKSQIKLKIINLDIKNIDHKSVTKIYNLISKSSSNVALDLKNVTTCVADFFEIFRHFQNKNLSLVNVDSKILATLYMTGYDQFVRIFEDNISLLADKHEIINRRFQLI